MNDIKDNIKNEKSNYNDDNDDDKNDNDNDDNNNDTLGELPGRMKSPLVAVSLYRDKSGLLTTETKLSNKEKQTRNTENKKQPKVCIFY